jgi:sugar phosphate isomerase/epimerase
VTSIESAGVVVPKFSVCELALQSTTLDEDIDLCSALQISWLGIDERKIEGDDVALVSQRLETAGVSPGVCTPSTLSILPSPIIQGKRHDPADRVEDICAGIDVLAKLHPTAILIVTGPAGDLDERSARSIVVDGLRTIADIAAQHAIPLALEPMRLEHRQTWSIITSLPETFELIEEVGKDIKIVYDVWHMWRTPDVIALTEEYAREFVDVQLSDYREPTRMPMDRVLPGQGVIDLPAIFGALKRGGYDGIYDLEVFSHLSLPDSIWKRSPKDWVAEGRQGFLEAWASRY